MHAVQDAHQEVGQVTRVHQQGNCHPSWSFLESPFHLQKKKQEQCLHTKLNSPLIPKLLTIITTCSIKKAGESLVSF